MEDITHTSHGESTNSWQLNEQTVPPAITAETTIQHPNPSERETLPTLEQSVHSESMNDGQILHFVDQVDQIKSNSAKTPSLKVRISQLLQQVKDLQYLPDRYTFLFMFGVPLETGAFVAAFASGLYPVDLALLLQGGLSTKWILRKGQEYKEMDPSKNQDYHPLHHGFSMHRFSRHAH